MNKALFLSLKKPKKNWFQLYIEYHRKLMSDPYLRAIITGIRSPYE